MPHVRRLPAAGAATLAVLMLLGCASVTNGDGARATASRVPSAASSSPTDAPTTAATTSTSTLPAAHLTDLLAPAPPGSRPWDTPWAQNATPTLDEFVAHVYPPKSLDLAKSQLKAQGIKDIAHRTWIGTDANQADTILLRFATTAGAVSRYRSASAAKAEDKGQRSFAVPGHTAIGYYSPVLDELGDIRTIVYGQVGDIVVEVFFYSPAKLDKATAIAAATAQLRLLPS
jgi:hypothetical protein